VIDKKNNQEGDVLLTLCWDEATTSPAVLSTPEEDLHLSNIHNYSNNKVEIFNRWGARVYETRGYDPYGDGSSNVFRGYSDGKATIDKGTKLPSGTYYYVITYEYTDSNGSRMIKKAANLHLETN